MTDWDGRTERRTDYVNIVAELAVVKQQLKDMVERREVMHRENQVVLSRFAQAIDGNDGEGLRTQIRLQEQATQSVLNELHNHSQWDRWLFGSILTMLLAILGRVFIGYR